MTMTVNGLSETELIHAQPLQESVGAAEPATTGVGAPVEHHSPAPGVGRRAPEERKLPAATSRPQRTLRPDDEPTS